MSSNNVTTLIVGILIGMTGGFVLGAFLGKSVFQLATVLIHLVSRQGKSDQERMKFELLLQ